MNSIKRFQEESGLSINQMAKDTGLNWRTVRLAMTTDNPLGIEIGTIKAFYDVYGVEFKVGKSKVSFTNKK